MKNYSVFGGRLQSDLEFPDLSPAPPGMAPTWTLRVLSQASQAAGGRLVGEYEVVPGWVFRLYHTPDGVRLEYGTTGSYEVLAGGSQIVWHRGPDPSIEVVRATILGPVMALALHQSGTLCLHGSAVAVQNQGIAFLGPKFYGKSTLALILTAAGARLITDDLVAVDPAPSPTVRPGVHSVRLLSDSAERLSATLSGTKVSEGLKKTVTEFPERRLAWNPVPLSAVYLLEPVTARGSGNPFADRIPVTPAYAAVAVACQRKLVDSLVGYEVAGVELGWIATVVRSVPVYRLEVVRDFDRLSDVAARILKWHTYPQVLSPPVAAGLG